MGMGASTSREDGGHCGLGGVGAQSVDGGSQGASSQAGMVTVAARPVGSRSLAGCGQQGCSHGFLHEMRVQAAHVSRVMGGHGVVAWLKPIWGPPPGVLAHSAAKKHA